MGIFDLSVGSYFVFTDSPYQVAEILFNNGFEVSYRYTATHLYDGSSSFFTKINYSVQQMISVYR